MNENLNTEAVRQALNRSSSRIGQNTLTSLRSARELALARYDARNTAPAFAWAGILTGGGRASGSHHRSYYYWLAAALLAAVLFSGATYWQHALEHDISDEDIAILTDDLPIDVYVD